MTFYGYDFTQRNSGGLGAIIHDVMLANQYCEQNGLIFAFIREGYEIPRLNGSIDDIPEKENKYWHSYFTSFPKILDKKVCIGIWPNYLPNTNVTKWDIQSFSHILKNKICTFQPEVYNDIVKLVNDTPFNEKTDIVLHIRRTQEKCIENAEFLPIQTYIDECENALNELSENICNEKHRIYICTDNQDVCFEIKNYFYLKNIEVVWDEREPNIPIQEIRWLGKLSKSIAQKETMNAFKNIFIMKSAKYLIGCRMSYFFRIAELLGYPNKCINLQDNDLFGIAPYSSIEYHIRPFKKNAFLNFINENMNNSEIIKKYSYEYRKTGIVTIPDFISFDLLSNIKNDIENYPWWSYAILPYEHEWNVKYKEEINFENKQECLNNLENKNFCYRFKRCLGNHYDTCYCISCKLNDTVSSFHVTDYLSKIVGCKYLIPKEIFLSNYSKDDFLSIHHDIQKGDISVTFSLTYDWYPAYGGILHFCDNEKKNIFKSILPCLGSVNIFKLDPENGLNHFVSCVNVNKNRYTLTAWYDVRND